MLNLLFISDNPKVENVKGVLQPLLKIIIDVVTDFDHGLKDVFEKRPATVCIQDQIDGVTGESVARHIQMLLGTSAPKFILIHSGNDKAKSIKGLYDHLIDLSQPDDVLADEIISTLKLLLGDQWEKVYIPPKKKSAPAKPPVVPPEETLPAEKIEFSMKPKIVAGTLEFERAQAISDDLAELLIIEAKKAGGIESPPNELPSVFTEPSPLLKESSNTETVAEKTSFSSVIESTASSETFSGNMPSKKTSAQTPDKNVEKIPKSPITRPPSPQASVAAEFRIRQNTHHADESIPEDLLLAFEENYRSESMFMKRNIAIVLIVIVCVVGGWYFFKGKPKFVTTLLHSLKISKEPEKVLVAAPIAPVPQPVSPPVRQAEVAPLLPAFIPKDGYDSNYKDNNAGWDRYVGKSAEFRIFTDSGRIQALQVLAAGGVPISEQFLKSILMEFTGSNEYVIVSRNSKDGVRVENGRITTKGDIVIYRKNGAVKAFVVSVK